MPKCALCNKAAELSSAVKWSEYKVTFEFCWACADEYGGKLGEKLFEKMVGGIFETALTAAPGAVPS